MTQASFNISDLIAHSLYRSFLLHYQAAIPRLPPPPALPEAKAALLHLSKLPTDKAELVSAPKNPSKKQKNTDKKAFSATHQGV